MTIAVRRGCRFPGEKVTSNDLHTAYVRSCQASPTATARLTPPCGATQDESAFPGFVDMVVPVRRDQDLETSPGTDMPLPVPATRAEEATVDLTYPSPTV